MVVIHGKSKRKSTGGRFKDTVTKRLAQKGSHAAHTKVAEMHQKTVPAKGGSHKVKLFAANKLNLYDPKSKKYSTETITSVSDNAADRHFVRHNILTRGAVVATSKGKAKITNRPGQEGMLNAVLLE